MTTVIWGADAAARYDAASTEMFDPAVLGPAVDLLAALADGGPALEFAVGTGRVALPLAERGVPVAGSNCHRTWRRCAVSRRDRRWRGLLGP